MKDSVTGPRATVYMPGQEVVPGYTLIERLGSGFSGDVWKARAAGGTAVAVKIVRSLSDIGGSKELQALKTLRNVRHPNLCPVHAFWTKDQYGNLLEDGELSVNEDLAVDDSVAWAKGTMNIDFASQQAAQAQAQEANSEAEQLIIVMGLGDCTLFDRLRAVRRAAEIDDSNSASAAIKHGLKIDECIRYAHEAANAIDLLNKTHRIYHCDIKPQNLLLIGGGVQVCDFGIATRIKGDFRQTGRIFASSVYAAPEILNPDPNTGPGYHRTVDQYALAVTYFELRTGLLPFDVTTEASLIISKCAGKLNLDHLTPAESQVLRRALDPNPTKRYDSCSDFVKALERSTQPKQLRGVMVSVSALFVLFIVVLAAVFAPGSSAPDLLPRLLAKFDELKSKSEVISDPATDPTTDLTQALTGLVYLYRDADQGAYRDLQKDIRTFASDIGRPWLDDCRARLNQDPQESVDLDTINRVLTALLPVTPSSKPAFSLITPESDPVFLVDFYATQLELSLRKGNEFAESDADDLKKLLEIRAGMPSSQKTLIAAVTLAVRHGRTEQETVDFTDDFVFSDLERAQKEIDAPGNVLPIWQLREWNKLREGKEGGQGFIVAFKKAIAAKSPLKERIGATWHNLAIEAEIADLKRIAIDGDWVHLKKKLPEFLGRDLESIDDQSRLKAELLKKLADAIDERLSADELSTALTNGFNEIFDEATKSQDSLEYLRDIVPSCIAEVTDKAKTEKLSFDSAYKLHQSAKELVGNDSAAIAPLDFEVLLAAIWAGPDKFANESVQAILSRKDLLRTDTKSLASAMQLEQSLQLEQSSKDINRAFLPLLPDFDQAVRNRLPSGYLEYITAISHRNAFHLQEAAKLLKSDSLNRIPTKSVENIAESLGPSRCQWIANLMMDVAIVESGVPDTEVLKRRYVKKQGPESSVKEQAAEKWVDEAQRWIGNSDSSPVVDRYRRERFIVQMSTASPDPNVGGLSVPKTLHDAFAQLENGKPDSNLAQSYRAGFEYYLAKCKSKPDDLKEKSRLLVAATALLDVAREPGKPITDKRWFDEILSPTMQQIKSSDAKAELKQPFMRHYRDLQFEIISAGEQDTKRLSELLETLELAFRFGAEDQNEEIQEQERVRLYLEAAELVEKQAELLGQILFREEGSLKLKQLKQYLDAAEKIDSENPKLQLKRAIANYYDAIRSDQLANLEKAAKDLNSAIEKAENVETFDFKLLYQAYYQHANALVLAAFHSMKPVKQPAKQKEHLEMAVKSATAAVTISKQNASIENTNAAYAVLGHAYEDLAYYCRESSVLDRKRNYQLAINNLQTAVNLTNETNNLKARYNLARCRFRYAVSFPGPKTDFDQALLDLGSDPEETHKDLEEYVEWLAWRAQILIELGRVEDAIKAAKEARVLCGKRSSGNVSDSLRQQVWFLYGTYLLVKERSAQSQASSPKPILSAEEESFLVELLTGFEELDANSISFSYYILVCRLLERADRIIDFAEKVASIPENLFLEAASDQELCELLAGLTFDIRFYGFPVVYGGPSRMDAKKASDCLQRLLDKQKLLTGDYAKQFEIYANIIGANLFSLTESPEGNRVEKFLEVLQLAQPRVREDTVVKLRNAMYSQLKPLLHEHTTGVKGDKWTKTQLVGLNKNLSDDNRLAFIRQLELLYPKLKPIQIEFLSQTGSYAEK